MVATECDSLQAQQDVHGIWMACPSLRSQARSFLRKRFLKPRRCTVMVQCCVSSRLVPQCDLWSWYQLINGQISALLFYSRHRQRHAQRMTPSNYLIGFGVFVGIFVAHALCSGSVQFLHTITSAQQPCLPYFQAALWRELGCVSGNLTKQMFPGTQACPARRLAAPHAYHPASQQNTGMHPKTGWNLTNCRPPGCTPLRPEQPAPRHWCPPHPFFCH